MLKSGIRLVVPLFFRNFAPRNDNKQIINIKNIKTMIKKIEKPFECDLYSIELDENNEKQIHIVGYTYRNDSDDFWELLEPCWFIIPLVEFIENLKEDEDYVNNQYSEYKQYIEDMSAKDMVDCLNTYFDGHRADAYLKFTDITIDTPCGDYIN